MKDRIIAACFLLFLIIGLSAAKPQSTTIPSVGPVVITSLSLQPIVTDSVQMGNDVQTMLQQANGNFVTLGQSFNNMVSVINDPTIGNQALYAAIQKLQPIAPVPTPVTNITVDLTSLPVGPLNGVDQFGINWGSGVWTASVQGVSAVCATVTGQPACPTRTITLPTLSNGTGATLVNITATCSVGCTFTLKDALAEVLSSGNIAAGALTILNTNWTKPSGAISFSTTSGPATAVTFTNLTYN